MRRPSVPRLVLYTLAIGLGLALVVAASTTTAAFGAYNLEWDGTSDFRALADEHGESEVVLETAPYGTSQPNGTVAFVLAPVEPYDEAASETVRGFVDAGGTLVVADGVGPHGNALLNDVGATARFDGDLLRDERNYYRGPNLTVSTNVTETRYTTGVERLTFNYGTAVVPNGATTVVASSEFAYLDRERTGTLSGDDELGERPVVTVETVGDGRVIAVGDASLFINTMLDQPDNAAFATAIVSTHDRTLLDYSRSGAQPPLVAALVTLRSSSVLQTIVGLVGVTAVWMAGRNAGSGAVSRTWDRVLTAAPDRVASRVPPWLRGSPARSPASAIDEEAMVAALGQRYPDWTEDRIRAAIGEVLSNEEENDPNE